jgi:hypothetical protein
VIAKNSTTIPGQYGIPNIISDSTTHSNMIAADSSTREFASSFVLSFIGAIICLLYY